MKKYMTLLPAFLATTFLAIGLAGDSEARMRTLQAAHSILVQTTGIGFDQTNPEASDFGRLKWRGGLILSSKAKEFGGYSGLALTDRGRRLMAVSDQGTWLSADLLYKGKRLAGLENARTGPLRARNGRALRRKKFSDAEEITLWKKGGRPYALISFERAHRIGRFSLADGGIGKPSSYLKLPKKLFKTTRNKGLEALTVLNDRKNRGTVLTFAERFIDKKGYHRGWLIHGKRSRAIRLKKRNGFDITGLATLPNGNVLVLERYFSMLTGVMMRIRELSAKDIRPRARLDGKILLTASMRYNIDNMEGISAHVSDTGETIITLISDDNFNKNGLQKTVLLQFALTLGEKGRAGR